MTSLVRARQITFASGPHHSIETTGLSVFALAVLFRTRYPGERLDNIGYRTPKPQPYNRRHQRHLAAIERRIGRTR